MAVRLTTFVLIGQMDDCKCMFTHTRAHVHTASLSISLSLSLTHSLSLSLYLSLSLSLSLTLVPLRSHILRYQFVRGQIQEEAHYQGTHGCQMDLKPNHMSPVRTSDSNFDIV